VSGWGRGSGFFLGLSEKVLSLTAMPRGGLPVEFFYIIKRHQIINRPPYVQYTTSIWKIVDWCKIATRNSFAGAGNGDRWCFPILVKSNGRAPSPPQFHFPWGIFFTFPSPNRGISRGELGIGSPLPSPVGELTTVGRRWYAPQIGADSLLREMQRLFCPTLTLDEMMVSVLQGHWPC